MTAKKILVGAALAIAIAIGAWSWWRWQTTPVPPSIALDAAEPAVAKAIEAALEKVREQPRSGAAWGLLSMTLLANGYHEDALPCLAYAERFDPHNPRWTYFRGIQLHLTR